MYGYKNVKKGEVKVEIECEAPETNGAQDVTVPCSVWDSVRSTNSQLTHVVTGLCHTIEGLQQPQSMVWSRPLPTIPRFSGRVRRPKELDEWTRDAEECITQVGLKGPEAVAYLCGFLDRPALTRVRNSAVGTVPELFECLENAFGHKLSFVDLQKQLESRVQRQGEGVWEFADSLREIEQKMQSKRARSKDDRKWLLHTWFCRNLRDRKIGVRLQKWWEEHLHVDWEELVQRAADKWDEVEQIQREEAELHRSVVGKGVRGISSSKVCSLCGEEGHLGFQCVHFGKEKLKLGNGQPCGRGVDPQGSRKTQ